MPVGHEQVLPTVVVVIDELGGPAQKGHGYLRYTSGIAVVGVIGIAIVAIEHIVIVGKGGVEEIHPAIVLIIPYRNAHGGGFASIFIQSIPGGITVIFEGAVAFVDVQVVGGGVIGHQQ